MQPLEIKKIISFFQDELFLDILQGNGFESLMIKGNNYIFTFLLPKEVFIKELYKKIKTLDNLTPAYFINNNESGLEFLFYSYLGSNFLFKLLACEDSLQKRKCKSLQFIIYNSLEEMITDLLMIVRRQQYLGEVIYLLSDEILLKKFMKENPFL